MGVAAALGRWDLFLDVRPLLIRHVARVTQRAAVVAGAVLVSPLGELLRIGSRWGGRPPYGIGVPQYGLSEPVEREPPAMSITMIGLDTATPAGWRDRGGS